MNISPDGFTVRFKTEPKELFLAEKSGAKSNLLCLMDFEEWHLLKKHNPTKIIIQHQHETFLRTLTNIHLEGEMLNTWVVTFSWIHEEHRSNAHTISLDEPGYHSAHAETVPEEPPTWVQSINIGLRLRERLETYRGDKTYDEAISNLLNHYTKHHTTPGDCANCEHLKSCKEGEPCNRDESFVTVVISKSMHDAIQKVGHGRSANSVIREFHKAYLDNQAYEREAKHD